VVCPLPCCLHPFLPHLSCTVPPHIHSCHSAPSSIPAAVAQRLTLPLRSECTLCTREEAHFFVALAEPAREMKMMVATDRMRKVMVRAPTPVEPTSSMVVHAAGARLSAGSACRQCPGRPQRPSALPVPAARLAVESSGSWASRRCLLTHAAAEHCSAQIASASSPAPEPHSRRSPPHQPSATAPPAPIQALSSPLTRHLGLDLALREVPKTKP